MEWTREMKYRTFEDVSDELFKEMKKKVKHARWRQMYHIQPISGLLNDPNGLVYHEGLYHVFYQWHPFGAIHGMKYWYHVTSPDLVHFTDEGVAISPDTLFDSHGAYSGSAIVVDNEVKLVYTGNHRTKDWERVPYQVISTLKGNEDSEKKVFVKGAPNGYTEHFRDPKVWYDENTEYYYAVIGAQRVDKTGAIVVYQSKDFNHWELKGELKTDYSSFGYMWECPDYFNLDGKGVVLFCPQGIERKGDAFRNRYQSGYLLGHLDIKSLKFDHYQFEELDYGFDFYAPQTLKGAQEKRILIGWMGLPETTYPTDKDGWAHCLTIPRVLSVQDNHLFQQPIKALQQLRHSKKREVLTINDDSLVLEEWKGTHYELLVDVLDNQASHFHIDIRQSGDEYTRCSYDAKARRFTFDRSLSGALPGGVDGTTRVVQLSNALDHMQIFVDTSSVEIFLNGGQYVFSSRIFPNASSDGIRIVSENGNVTFDITKYNLKEG